MSRIGKKPITFESDVSVTVQKDGVLVAGPKGQLLVVLVPGVTVAVVGKTVEVKQKGDSKDSSLVGLCRSLIQNAVVGVTKGWSKTLELVGVGFRAQLEGTALVLHVGFSHPVKIEAPDGISFAITENKITVTGADKYLVGDIAASVKRVKKPEPYKGKGIRYLGEVIRKKLGKAAKTVGAAGAK